ncbi:MAG: hypothetical protein P8Y02_05135, partial [Deinococcales bacterium]
MPEGSAWGSPLACGGGGDTGWGAGASASFGGLAAWFEGAGAVVTCCGAGGWAEACVGAGAAGG